MNLTYSQILNSKVVRIEYDNDDFDLVHYVENRYTDVRSLHRTCHYTANNIVTDIADLNYRFVYYSNEYFLDFDKLGCVLRKIGSSDWFKVDRKIEKIEAKI